MSICKELAEILFPHITKTNEYYESKYPARNLSTNAKVTRFAPSPTGFIHIGGLFASLISERIAHQSDGVFFLRIEDTDKKREVEGGVSEIIDALADFNVKFDEGPISDDKENGAYSPYKQSDRMEIYQTFAKSLVERGLAYPCFCSEEDLDNARKEQEFSKVRTGYYGSWAIHRNMSLDSIKSELSAKKKFILRLKSAGSHEIKKTFKDLIKGEVDMPENDQDIVIIKSDGLPTYHFAHAIDDHFMRTTNVIRGDEWLSSLPLHVQLFETLGWDAPNYAHISPILKMDGSSKRKLSKRKDPEAAVRYYHEEGYPNVAVTEYLLNLANSNFEDWRRENPTLPNEEFKLSLDNMSVSGALFDIVKLTDISKEIIAKMPAELVYTNVLEWAKKYDTELFDIFNEDKNKASQILNIERNTEKPRKDIAKWSDTKYQVEYFYNNLFKKEFEFPETIKTEDIQAILNEYSKIFDLNDTKDEWFAKIKDLSEKLGFSKDVKAYKKNPELFKGHVGDVSMVIRISLTGRRNTPDLYEIMKVLGKVEIINRLQ